MTSHIGPYPLDDIYCGDSAVMLAALPDGCIDLTVTSPPYDNLRAYNGFSWDFNAIATQLYRVTKPGGVVVWVVGDATINGSETGSSFRQALGFMEIGFNLHDTMIYGKKNPQPLNHNRYEQGFEYMFVFSKGDLATFNPIKKGSKMAGKKRGGTMRNGGKDELQVKHTLGRYAAESMLDNIFYYAIGSELDNGGKHPGVFPESLARDHIISWSNPGDVVLDPFAGSGTTAKMSKLFHRHWLGFDISQEYVDLARRRVAAAIAPDIRLVEQPAKPRQDVLL